MRAKMIRICRNSVGLLILISSLALAGCSSPAGSEGPKGPEGEQGPVGPAGEDGSMMYADDGAPKESVGDIGDYYLNSSSGELYGPKGSSGWGNPIIVLMGDDGQDGEDGSQIYAGNGAPEDTLGVKGDYYLNQSNFDLYGPKSGNGWEAPANLKGDDGQNGSEIHAGNGAPADSLGRIGDYYFDKDSGDFYGPKTSNGWGTPTNLKGQDGQDGVDGRDGNRILSGNGTPGAFDGSIGDFYLDKTSYDLYGPKQALFYGGWGTPINLKGAQGNANVTRYILPGFDFSTDIDKSYEIGGISSKAEFLNSAWLIYLGNDYFRYPLSGWGKSGDSYYRVFNRYWSNSGKFSIQRIEGPGEDYTRIEIIRIEASNTVDMRKVKGQNSIIPPDLDVSDYEAVANYYGF